MELRRKKSIGGGFAIIFKEHFNAQKIERLYNTSNTEIEITGIAIKLVDDTYIKILSAYLPPKSDSVNLGSLTEFNWEQTILFGDLNSHCKRLSPKVEDKNGKELRDIAKIYNLNITGFPTKSTYVNKNIKSSPDIMILGPNIAIDRVSSRRILEPIRNSDHIPIMYNLKLLYKKVKTNQKIRYNWNKLDVNKYHKALEYLYNEICKDNDTNSTNDYYKAIELGILNCINRSCPIKTNRMNNKNNSPWWNDQLRYLIKKKINYGKSGT